MSKQVQIACNFADESPSMTNYLTDYRVTTMLAAMEETEALSRALTTGGELPLEQEGLRP